MSESSLQDETFPHVVILSGRIASGKSTFAASLSARMSGHIILTKNLLAVHARRSRLEVSLRDRATLQSFGRGLDSISGGEWLSRDLAIVLRDADPSRLVIIDSIRTPEQIPHLRELLGSRMLHVHLTASEATREQRFDKRGAARDEGFDFENVNADLTEAAVDDLAESADLVIDTDFVGTEDAVDLAIATLALD